MATSTAIGTALLIAMAMAMMVSADHPTAVDPAAEDALERAAECMMWSKLENKTLPLQNQGHANCSTNAQCTGFDCNGLYKDKELKFGMRVLPCQKTPGVEIYGSAPQFNARNFSHIFTHEPRYEVPGASLNLSMIPGISLTKQAKQMRGILEVHIKKNPDGKSLMLGLIALGCIQENCLFKNTVFNHTQIPIPSCEKSTKEEEEEEEEEDATIAVNTPCSLSRLNVCGPNQVCQQQSGDQASSDEDLGLCECRSGYVSQPEDGSCSPPSQRVPKLLPATKDASKQAGDDAGSGGLMVALLSVIVVVVVVAAVSILVITRTRLAPRLRARLTSTPYEDIIISRQDPNSGSGSGVVVA